MSSAKRRPFALFVLVVLLFLQAAGAIYGGFCLVLDPTGGLLKMGEEVLAKTPFGSFLIPGLILGLLLGLIPLMLIYPLLVKPQWKWAKALNIYKHQYWAWTYSLFTGIIIIIWIDVQIWLIGYSELIQTIIAALGILIVIFTLWPSVMKHFRRSRSKTTRQHEPTEND